MSNSAHMLMQMPTTATPAMQKYTVQPKVPANTPPSAVASELPARITTICAV